MMRTQYGFTVQSVKYRLLRFIGIVALSLYMVQGAEHRRARWQEKMDEEKSETRTKARRGEEGDEPSDEESSDEETVERWEPTDEESTDEDRKH